VWQPLVVYFALVALGVVLNYRALRNYLLLPWIPAIKEQPERWPHVSVIVPLGDESASDPTALLGSLEALDYPATDVVIADYRPSGDDTEPGVSTAVRRLRLGEIPAGWSSRSFACWRAAEASEGEWLLFTAAHCTHHPDSLKRALGWALRERVAALSLLLQQRCLTFWERLLLPYYCQQLFTSVPRERVNQAGDLFALAVDDYFLVRREVYFEGGGHASVAARQLPESALAAILKSRGAAVQLARGEQLGSTRPYAGFHQLANRASRKALALLRWLSTRAVLTLAGAGLSLLAIPCAAYGLALHSRPFELAALVTYVASVSELFLWNLVLQVPLSYALGQPVAAATAALITARSMLSRRPA